MKKSLKRVILSVFFFLFSSSFTEAFLVKSLTLSQLVHLSDRIFKGTLADIQTEDDIYESKRLVTYFTFQVDECLKGPCSDTLVIKQASGLKNLPEYELGETYLLFLPADSEETGLVAPTGIWQGKFSLKKAGERWVVPALTGESRLGKNLKEEAGRRSLSIPTNLLSSADYETFKIVIKKIVEESP